jgi:hypothetical protein
MRADNKDFLPLKERLTLFAEQRLMPIPPAREEIKKIFTLLRSWLNSLTKLPLSAPVTAPSIRKKSRPDFQPPALHLGNDDASDGTCSCQSSNAKTSWIKSKV